LFRNPNHTLVVSRSHSSGAQMKSGFLTRIKMSGAKRILRGDSETVSNSHKALRIDGALIGWNALSLGHPHLS
jgi:hypothetical protein